MEISPIPGIRALPSVKTPPADPELSRVFDIENSSQPGDDSYTGNGKKAAGGQDDEADELEEGLEAERVSRATEDGRGTRVNFFA